MPGIVLDNFDKYMTEKYILLLFCVCMKGKGGERERREQRGERERVSEWQRLD